MPVAKIHDNTAELVANMDDFVRLVGEAKADLVANGNATEHTHSIFSAMDAIRAKMGATRITTLSGMVAKLRVAMLDAEFKGEDYEIDPIFQSEGQDAMFLA